jgi:hypothetical protein
MRRIAAYLLPALCVVAPGLPSAAEQPASEGHPHKWVAVEKSMVDFLGDGFELKAVVYDTTETGAKPEQVPDVHYFLQKKAQLVRCDFRKRQETSYYWCALMTKPGAPTH